MKSLPLLTLLLLIRASLPSPLPQSESQASGPCKKITLIFARGTTETGNMGFTVGPSLARQLRSTYGNNNVAVQGVDYGAGFLGAMTGAMMQGDGVGNMLKHTKTVMDKCPETKVILSGYSQGAEQVHGTIEKMGVGAVKLGAAITFGDPLYLLGQWYSMPKARTKVYCATGDFVCDAMFLITPSHLAYTVSDTAAAAKWAKTVIP
ncbi:cutinase-domain-containing protein [Venturia nashicola]|uniref:Cutinase n=1 Tax=Venturia nashicola TaxID=86259 RepID=A0A4Z1NTV6_9PEZI|nr:cutinase-domain-containing protein [Venturia nashicola]TLD25707.1 cutinase-domain-containing protein [Venturia nashicola]